MLILIKYIIGILLVGIIIMAPAWLARQNKKDKLQMGLVRISSWLFGWTGVGWIYAVYLAVRK